MQKVNVFLLTSAKIKIITNLFLCRYVLQVLGNIYAKFLEVLRSSFYFIDVCLGLTFILYFQFKFSRFQQNSKWQNFGYIPTH